MVGVLEWWHGMALAAGDGARGLAVVVVVAVEWGARVVGVEVLAVVVVLGLSDDVADGAGNGSSCKSKRSMVATKLSRSGSKMRQRFVDL